MMRLSPHAALGLFLVVSACQSGTESSDLPVPGVTPTLTTNHATIEHGSSVLLTWSVEPTPGPCVASGDWTGTKSCSGSSETVGPFPGPDTIQFILTVGVGPEARADTVSVIVTAPPPPSPPTLAATVSTEPASGSAPLTEVDVRVEVSGTAAGSIRYRIDCTTNGSFDFDTVSVQAVLNKANLCNYSEPATYTLTVVADRQGVSAFSTTPIVVTPPPPPPPQCLGGKDATITPDYTPYKALMEKVTRVGPLYVTSSPAVALCAREHVGYMADQMLRNRPDIASTLRREGTILAIFGRNEGICDLPYYSDITDEHCDNPGGAGAVPGREASTCSEKNALPTPDDIYRRGQPDGINICLHEIGHAIMNVGLSRSDYDRIKQRFDDPEVKRLWEGDFLLTHHEEFWAEMTRIYFCGNSVGNTHDINCANELQNYDRTTFDLVDGIYRGAADLR